MNPLYLWRGFEHVAMSQSRAAINAGVLHRHACVTVFLAAAFFSSAVACSTAASLAMGAVEAKRQPKSEKPKQAALSGQDRKMLEGLLKRLVFDPKGAKCVRVEAFS